MFSAWTSATAGQPERNPVWLPDSKEKSRKLSVFDRQPKMNQLTLIAAASYIPRCLLGGVAPPKENTSIRLSFPLMKLR